MDFYNASYMYLIDLLREKEYHFCNYTNHNNYKKCVILRHDVDFTLEKALDFARIENGKNVTSTYFVLLSTNFYNVFSKESFEILREIKALGHDIGLHFDEKRYEISDVNSLGYYILKESRALEELLGNKILTVSMHRPSKWILENDIKLDGIINTYSNYFFKDFKYLSDSRMFWREDVLDIVEKESYDRLHILTHPFWYSNKEETMKEKLLDFVINAKVDRYNNIKGNFREIEHVLKEEDLI